MGKRGPGRPAHEPTETTRKQVEVMSSFGIPQEDVAKVVGISPHTLRKHYAAVLETAEIKANARVAQSLYQKATGDGTASVTAAIFWLKTRARWKETEVKELVGKDGDPIHLKADFETMSADELRDYVHKETLAMGYVKKRG